MELDVGNVIAIAFGVGGGLVAWGAMRTKMAAHSNNLQDHEERIRVNENARIATDAHLRDAPLILERLRSIEQGITQLRTELTHSATTYNRITDALEGNRMVLTELSERLVRMEATWNVATRQ